MNEPSPTCAHQYWATVIYYDEEEGEPRAHLRCKLCGHRMVASLLISKLELIGIVNSMRGR